MGGPAPSPTHLWLMPVTDTLPSFPCTTGQMTPGAPGRTPVCGPHCC